MGPGKSFQKNREYHPPYPTRVVTLSSPQTTSKMEIQYKSFTDVELQARRDKGLCYRCDENFFVGHRCKASDDLELDNDEVEPDEQGEKDSEEHVTKLAKVSLNTVVRFSDPGTIKVRGRVEQEEVIILIDCGAKHNFISHWVVE